MGLEDLEKKRKAKRAYDQNYRIKNLEKIRKINHIYYTKNLEKIQAYARAHRAANPEMYREKVRVYRAKNIDKVRKACHDHHIANRELTREKNLKRKYGISSQKYEELLAFQNGGCAICGSIPNNKRLAVDHDHMTDKVRGLLCYRCNIALGVVEEDLKILEAIHKYIVKWKR